MKAELFELCGSNILVLRRISGFFKFPVHALNISVEKKQRNHAV